MLRIIRTSSSSEVAGATNLVHDNLVIESPLLGGQDTLLSTHQGRVTLFECLNIGFHVAGKGGPHADSHGFNFLCLLVFTKNHEETFSILVLLCQQGTTIADTKLYQVDPASFIRQHGKRLVFLHLRDQKADGTWAEALGEGDMDHVEIANALRKVDFTGYAVIELATPAKRRTRPTRESLKISRQFVRNTMGY